MKTRVAWVSAAAAAALFGGGIAAAAEVPNIERGRMLYENHCVVCHTPKVHSRPDRIPLNRAELREIVTTWVRHEGLPWREPDTEDVVHYLATTRYRY
jgi:mono/diheme cytochrome c family protein